MIYKMKLFFIFKIKDNDSEITLFPHRLNIIYDNIKAYYKMNYIDIVFLNI